MIVYRLEDKNGYGPFASIEAWPEQGYSDDSMHQKFGCTVPIPFHPIERSRYRFACKNKTQLRKYWGRNLDDFVEQGWIIRAYKVRKNYILFGQDFELAFLAEKAQEVVYLD